jgi:hypothetical protein
LSFLHVDFSQRSLQLFDGECREAGEVRRGRLGRERWKCLRRRYEIGVRRGEVSVKDR